MGQYKKSLKAAANKKIDYSFLDHLSDFATVYAGVAAVVSFTGITVAPDQISHAIVWTYNTLSMGADYVLG